MISGSGAAMRKIRVLIVDDAVAIRKLVSDVLASDPVLEVAGAASNGRIALAKIPQVNPDVITLDVEMRKWTDWKRCAKSASCIRSCR